MGAIHSTTISGNFGPKLNGSVRSNQKSFEKTGPPFEVDHFSRSNWSEFWLNGSRPIPEDIATDQQIVRASRSMPRGGTLGISGWGCAAGTLEPLTYTRASSAEFCYPLLE